jgi:hypothetical protein
MTNKPKGADEPPRRAAGYTHTGTFYEPVAMPDTQAEDGSKTDLVVPHIPSTTRFFPPSDTPPQALIAGPIYTAENPPRTLGAALDGLIALLRSQPPEPQIKKRDFWQDVPPWFKAWISWTMYLEAVWPHAPQRWRDKGRRRKRQPS